jgi:hypothetical protein
MRLGVQSSSINGNHHSSTESSSINGNQSQRTTYRSSRYRVHRHQQRERSDERPAPRENLPVIQTSSQPALPDDRHERSDERPVAKQNDERYEQTVGQAVKTSVVGPPYMSSTLRRARSREGCRDISHGPPVHGERLAARDKRRARQRAIGEGGGRMRKELESLGGGDKTRNR